VGSRTSSPRTERDASAHPAVRYPVPVTNRPENPAVRRAARVLALLPAVLVTCAAGTAFAETPEQWEDTPGVSPLHVILLLVVIPVGLFLLITLLVYLPSMSRGTGQRPGEAWRGEAEWFGGPGKGLAAVDEAKEPSVSESADPANQRGGASGSW
jgi:hypothetical protein